MKVLVALDVTQPEEIVAEIASRSWPSDTSFFLLHVVEPFPFTKAGDSLDRAIETAEAQLHETAALLRSPGCVAEELVLVGRPAKTIVKLAASLKVDLIIVGSRGHRAATRLLLGSTAETVLRHAACSVEVFRPDTNHDLDCPSEGLRILLATDGSDCSRMALHSVANRSWPQNTKFRVVSIPHPSLPISSFTEKELKRVIAMRHANRYAQSGAEILGRAGLTACCDTLLPYHGDGREIVEEAKRWHAHLIVLGSHGRRGLDRLRLGSVSEYVALHAPCSVEVNRGVATERELAPRTVAGDGHTAETNITTGPEGVTPTAKVDANVQNPR